MGSTSPERPQPVWCPGPFIPGRDWTRASRGVGLQQFCRAQISLSAQSEPLAGRDICCLTFLIYTSPPSHTNIQFCSPPFQTSPSPSITERAKGGKRKKRGALGTRRGSEGRRAMLRGVWKTLQTRLAAVGLECLSPPSISCFQGQRKERSRRAIHHHPLLPSVPPCIRHPAPKHAHVPRLICFLKHGPDFGPRQMLF